jgi:pimeloyl-ACP methyl ester carboxylesterase
MLLHGLFGALSNWEEVVNRFSNHLRVVIPMLPIYDMPIKQAGLEGLQKFVEDFVDFKKLDKMIIMGNSLGGHLAILYTLSNASKVDKLILTGSSGLFENTMGGSYPRRGSYDYIQERVAYTFYDPKVASKELVDEVFETTKSIPKCMRIVAIAKSAQRNNLALDLPKILVPTLLVWGLNDTITPPMVAHEFNRLIPKSKLKFIDQCCHAPMMEHPGKFNEIVSDFLVKSAA